jgi:hypothetical protein
VLRTFAIITRKANQQMATLHNRMVILEPAAWLAWLGEVDSDPQTMLGPAPEGILRIWPVDKRIGNVRNGGAELLKPQIPPEPAESAAEPAGRILFKCRLDGQGSHGQFRSPPYSGARRADQRTVS